MLKHLLVPLDGNASTEALLPAVRRFDGLGVSEITLLRSEMPVAIDEYAVVSEAAAERARTWLAGIRLRLSDLRATVHARAEIGPAASTTLECAGRIGADLILTCAARRSRLARFMFGTATEDLVQRSTVPLLTLPSPPFAMDALRTILVPLDGSRASRDILTPALDLARATGARLLLLCVLTPCGGGRGAFRRGEDGDPAREEFECAEEQLYAAGVECASAGAGFSVLVEYGDPGERIPAVCRDRGVDAVAMATRGRSSLARWLAPSTTLKVLRQAGLPLLTVRSVSAARPVGLGAPAALGRH